MSLLTNISVNLFQQAGLRIHPYGKEQEQPLNFFHAAPSPSAIMNHDSIAADTLGYRELPFGTVSAVDFGHMARGEENVQQMYRRDGVINAMDGM